MRSNRSTVYCRTRASLDAPFQNPPGGDVIEIEVTDPRHPLFGRRFALVSASRLGASSDGHVLVVYRDHMQLRLAVAATSLASRLPDGVPTKLTVEAMQELVVLADNDGGKTCSSNHGVSGNAPLKRCDGTSPTTSSRSSQR
jgi:hypothetical protein